MRKPVALLWGAATVCTSLTVIALASCGGSTPGPGGSAPPESFVPAPTPTPAATSSATLEPSPATPMLHANGVDVHLPLQEVTCGESGGVAVRVDVVYYADCGSYGRVIGAASGALQRLSAAPSGTAFTWGDASGQEHAATTCEGQTTTSYKSGEWTGFGIPEGGHFLLIDLRQMGTPSEGAEQTERCAQSA